MRPMRTKSLARLYSNENAPYSVVEGLRSLGHDVLTSYEAGNANQRIPDEQVLAFAVSQDRAVLTFNRFHFVRLHRQSRDHCGVVVCKYDADFSAVTQRIHAALEAHGPLLHSLLRVGKVR